MQWYEFDCLDDCENALLVDLARQLQANGQINRQASKLQTLALAGGNTPKPLYEKFSQQPWDWEHILITLTDERWVDRSHPDSNEAMLKHCLFHDQAQIAQFLSLKNSESTPEVGQIRTAHLIKQNAPSLDFVILGMGEDGHFASIFPGMDNTQQLLDVTQSEPCLAARPKDKPARLSLTLSYLLSAKQIYLFITGQTKRALIHEQLNASTTEHLPIYSLLTQRLCPVSIYWSAA